MPQPVATVAAHTAPMAIHFYTGDQFPSEYHNQAFVALRAGVRGNDLGHKVMAVFSDPDGQNAQVGDFLTGFRPNPGSNRVWGKPVGLESDAQGVLYVSSDHTTQAVFRVRVGPLMGQWEAEPPDTILAGQPLDLAAAIALTRFDREAAEPVAVADLSDLGGSAETPLTDLGDGRYRLEAALAGAETNGRKQIVVRVAQNTSEGPFEIALSRTLVVLPAEDLAIVDDELALGWTANAGLGLDSFEFDGSGPVFTGTAAGVLTADPLTRLLPWQLDMEPPAPIETIGYRALRLAIHPGDVVPAEGDVVEVMLESGRFQQVVLLGEGAGDYGLDLGRKEWQVIEVPLSAFGTLDQPIETVRFATNLEGRFYIDDLRLVRTEFAGPTVGPRGTRRRDSAALWPRAEFPQSVQQPNRDPLYPRPRSTGRVENLYSHRSARGDLGQWPPGRWPVRVALGWPRWAGASAGFGIVFVPATGWKREADAQVAAGALRSRPKL